MSNRQPVFDYYPRGTPVIMSERMEQAMEEAIAAGAGAGAANDAIENEMVRQLRDDPEYRSALREAYETAGVTLVSPTMGSLDTNLTYPEGVRQDLTRWQARIDAVDWFEKATTPAEARSIVERGNVGVVLNVQNLGAALEGDAAEVDRLYDAGVRIAQLTYNSSNLVGTGCTERIDAGLTNHGVEVVDRCHDREMVVDLSHCGKATTLDAIEVSGRPVAITHAFAQSLADHDRGKSKEELAALADVDGYLGILTVPFFLDPGNQNADFDLVFDHVDYAVEHLGIDRVGIGTDWGSWTPEVPEPIREGIRAAFSTMGFREEHGVEVGVGFDTMQRYEDWQVIPDGLADRGYDESERAKLLGENLLSFWERAT